MILIDKLPASNNINTIIFDIDSTITQWKNVKLFLEEALKTLKVPYIDESLVGLFNAMKYREYHALTTSEADDKIYSILLKQYIDILHKYNISGEQLKETMFKLEAEQTFISDEVPLELERLSKYYKLYCYTNWFREQAISKLDRYDLTKYFEMIYSSEDIYLKFTKVGFEWLAKKHNLDLKKTIAVGDSKNDIIPSVSAGMHAIYLNYKPENVITREKMRLFEAADASITEFKDIRTVLTKKL